jgi:hypothetical protein
MIDICDFIRINIEIRKNEIENSKEYNINKNCLKLLDQNNLLNMSFLTNPDNYDLIYRISSKSFDAQSIIKSNRLVGLSCALANINYITGIEFENIRYIQKFKYFLISFYILAGQVFSDGNHRVCYHYLLKQGIDKNRISSIIGTIDLCRRHKNIDWDNLHDFIQKLINNLFYVINQRDENILIEKIENFFI